MPRFYFDMDDGDGLARDTDGLLCDSLDDMRWEAIKALPDIAREVMPDGDRRVIKAVVREEGGKPIFEATLSLVARWL